MYMVVRSYERADPRFANEGFRRVNDELLPTISAIGGFVSYYAAYDAGRGTVTSVTVYESEGRRRRGDALGGRVGEGASGAARHD